jgi:hypothetical protein
MIPSINILDSAAGWGAPFRGGEALVIAENCMNLFPLVGYTVGVRILEDGRVE